MPKPFPSNFRLGATHVETGPDGAVFSVRVDLADPNDAPDLQRKHQSALNYVDAFCHTFLDCNRNVHDGLEGEGTVRFDCWPCDEFRMMPLGTETYAPTKAR